MAETTPMKGIKMTKRIKIMLPTVGILCIALFFGCGYRYYAGPLRPEGEAAQAADMKISDDGTVTFVKGRLEIGVRPMTDEELNRQFSGYSKGGISSTNPYTFGDWRDPELDRIPSRFTVFRLRVKNYMYPKMLVDPMRAVIVAQNGREYHPLDLSQLEEYYLTYVTGYAGKQYASYQERIDILKSSLYAGDPIFSGQEGEGFVVFPKFHHDVYRIRVRLQDVVLRFDFRNEPIEQIDVEYRFERDIGRVFPDGRIAEGL